MQETNKTEDIWTELGRYKYKITFHSKKISATEAKYFYLFRSFVKTQVTDSKNNVGRYK